MNVQQIIALTIVAVAAAYLIRSAVRAYQAFRSGKGCASGCGKCGVAAQIDAARKSAAKTPRATTIPLSDVKSVSTKRPR